MHQMFIALPLMKSTYIPNSKKMTVAVDGEIVEMKPPLKIRVHKHALKIRVPHDTASV